MKKLLVAMCAGACAVVLLTGCTGIMPGTGGSAVASLYSSTKGAVIAATPVGQTMSMTKVGTAESTAIVCIATGDSSVKKAMENGGITKIHHVDYDVMNVLGIYVKYTTVVYGE